MGWRDFKKHHESPARLQEVVQDLEGIPDGVLLWFSALQVTKNISNPLLERFSPKREMVVTGNYLSIEYVPVRHLAEGEIRGYYGTMRAGDVKRLLHDPEVRDHFVDFRYKLRDDHLQAMLNKPFYD